MNPPSEALVAAISEAATRIWHRDIGAAGVQVQQIDRPPIVELVELLTEIARDDDTADKLVARLSLFAHDGGANDDGADWQMPDPPVARVPFATATDAIWPDHPCVAGLRIGRVLTFNEAMAKLGMKKIRQRIEAQKLPNHVGTSPQNGQR
jgi:hypothetical protein